MKKEAEKEKANKVPQQLIYIGPSIAGVVMTGTIFRNGIPKELKEIINQHPNVGYLIVPIEKLPQAIKEIGNQKGAMHILYEDVKQLKIKKGV